MPVSNPSSSSQVNPDPAPAPFTQTYSTAARSHTAATAATVVTTAATLAAYGLTAVQMNGVLASVNALVADILEVKKVLNAVVDDCQAAGVSA